MKFTYDPQDILHYFQTLVNTPSPVGYYVQMKPVINQLAEELNETVEYEPNGLDSYVRDDRSGCLKPYSYQCRKR